MDLEFKKVIETFVNKNEDGRFEVMNPLFAEEEEIIGVFCQKEEAESFLLNFIEKENINFI